MFGLDLLSKLIAGEPPAIDTGRCLRRYRRATCQVCIEKCPVGAVRMNRLGPRIVGDCRGCGVCVSACPAGVFSLDSTSHSGLISAMHSTGEVDVRCSIGQAKVGGMKVPCLGYLSPSTLLALGAGRREVRLHTGGCVQCSLKSARSLIEDTVLWTNALVEAFALPATVRLVAEGANVASRSEGTGYSRRELFARLGGRGAQAGGTAFTMWKQQLPFVGVGASQDHLLDHPARLLAIQLKHLASMADDNDRILLPLRRPMVIDSCDLCGLCATTCPSCAMTEVGGGSTAELRWDAGRCWSCGLCKSLCPLDALEYEEGLRAVALLDQPGAILATAAVGTCSDCGRRFVCRQGEILCLGCRGVNRQDRSESNPFGLGRPDLCGITDTSLAIQGGNKR